MKHITIIGLDIAKNVFQVCALNQAGKVTFNHKVNRDKLMSCLLQHADALIAMEACSSSHYWARRLIAQGLRVKLIPAQHVKAFCRGNKNDAQDALAIAEAANRPSLHEVAVKSLEQQDIQALLRIRMRLIKPGACSWNTASLFRKVLSILIAIYPEYSKMLRMS